MEGPDHKPALRAMLGRWGAHVAWVESASFGLTLIQDARRSGLPIRELEADTDKVARALAATPAFEAGQVYFCKGPWLSVLEDELLNFPNSAHDDQVDVVSYGVRVFYQSQQRSGGLPDLGDRASRYDDSVTVRGSGW
jgi:predicted phage terminase large subunit-like protein